MKRLPISLNIVHKPVSITFRGHVPSYLILDTNMALSKFYEFDIYYGLLRALWLQKSMSFFRVH